MWSWLSFVFCVVSCVINIVFILSAVSSAFVALLFSCHVWWDIPYFPAHKMHRDFFIRNFRKKNDECILILVIYWKKAGLLHTKISNHNIIYSSQKPRKSSSWLFSLDASLSSYKMSSYLPSAHKTQVEFRSHFSWKKVRLMCQEIR
jgi:hypothetical protein